MHETDTATAEIVQTIEHVQVALDQLAVRGLRFASSEQLNTLGNMKEELERIGAQHMASRIDVLLQQIKNSDNGAAKSLLRAQASLRVFDRLLTLESTSAQLSWLMYGAVAISDEEDGYGCCGCDSEEHEHDDDE